MLLRLSRLSFNDDELPELCAKLREIRQLLSRVRKFKDLNVRPLYNVWDQTLEPPDVVEERYVKLSWLGQGSLRSGMVRVPWRGE